MILQCPQCKNQFKPIKFRKAEDGSQLVECLTCNHVFAMPSEKQKPRESYADVPAQDPVKDPASKSGAQIFEFSEQIKYPPTSAEVSPGDLSTDTDDKPQQLFETDVPLKTKQRILIVDDTEFFRKVLTDLFTDNEYDVMTAVDGADALAKIKKDREQIDLLLLDLQLPKMNGFEVLDNLHRSGISKDLPILIITGIHQKPEEVKLVKELGATGFVSKANPPEYFLFRVDQILNPEKAVWVEPKREDT